MLCDTKTFPYIIFCEVVHIILHEYEVKKTLRISPYREGVFYDVHHIPLPGPIWPRLSARLKTKTKKGEKIPPSLKILLYFFSQVTGEEVASALA